VTRRELTKFLGLVSLAFLFATCASAGRKLLKRILKQSPGGISVASTQELPVGGYKLFHYPTENQPRILLRLSEEKFVAFDQRCTHLSCPVHFNPATEQLVCPCHEGFFSAFDGQVLAGPPRRALARLSVSTSNARVWVREEEVENA
jgi:Rieske Fe-S protein